MTHFDLVANLLKPGEDILKQMTPEKANLMHMALLCSGEAGEIVDVIKKHTVYNQELNVAHLVEEIGDLQFSIEGICQSIGVTMETAKLLNIKKLQKRYADGYSDKAAQERADKKHETI